MDARPPVRGAARVRPPPHYLVPKVRRAKDRVEEQLEVVASGRIAMQVEAARRLQDAAQLDEPRSHHREVREHVARTQEDAKRLHDLRDTATALNEFLAGRGGGV